MQEQFQPRFIRVYSIVWTAVFLGLLFFQLTDPVLTRNVRFTAVRAGLNVISQNFLWRKDLIKDFNNFRFMMGDQVFAQAVIGKEGWMFFTGEKSMEDHQKILRLNPKDLQRSANNLNLFNKQVAGNGGKLIVVVVPDKHTIYPQFMPDQIPVLGQMSRLDQIMNFMQEQKTDVEIVDLRPILINASKTDEVYYKTDTHWNCLGAYYGYREVLSRIAATYPEVKPHPLTDFNIRSTNLRTWGIPLMLGIQIKENSLLLKPKFQPARLDITSRPAENNKSIRLVENVRKDLPTALVFHDSFYDVCFNELFESHFSRTTAIHVSLINGYSQLIYKEKPDVVIIETAERFAADVLNILKVRNGPQ